MSESASLGLVSTHQPGRPRREQGLNLEVAGFGADCRTDGPGGQHRDKAGTAVRATYRPTGAGAVVGAVVVVDTERRLRDNRRLALELLRKQHEQADAEAERAVGVTRWRTHDQLVRGNPTRTERP